MTTGRSTRQIESSMLDKVPKVGNFECLSYVCKIHLFPLAQCRKFRLVPFQGAVREVDASFVVYCQYWRTYQGVHVQVSLMEGTTSTAACVEHLGTARNFKRY